MPCQFPTENWNVLKEMRWSNHYQQKMGPTASLHRSFEEQNTTKMNYMHTFLPKGCTLIVGTDTQKYEIKITDKCWQQQLDSFPPHKACSLFFLKQHWPENATWRKKARETLHINHLPNKPLAKFYTWKWKVVPPIKIAHLNTGITQPTWEGTVVCPPLLPSPALQTWNKWT